MVMDRHREDALGAILADHVIVQNLAYIRGCWYAVTGFHKAGLVLLTDYIHAKLDALIADEHGRTCDELAHLMLAFAAERAVQGIF